MQPPIKPACSSATPPAELLLLRARLLAIFPSDISDARRPAFEEPAAPSESWAVIEVNTDDFRGRLSGINLLDAFATPADAPARALREARFFMQHAENRATWRNLQAHFVFAAYGLSVIPRESALGSIGLPITAAGLYLYAAMPALDLWRRADSLPGYSATSVRLRGAMHAVFPMTLSALVVLLPQGLSCEQGFVLVMSALCVHLALYVGASCLPRRRP